MTEDDLRKKWFPVSLYAARMHRMEYVRDHYPNCRHHGRIDAVTGTFICGKNGKRLGNCNDCRTCPNCNGRIGIYRRQVSYIRTGAYITEEYTCMNCGAYYVRVYFEPKPQKKQGGCCQVEGCTHRAYEGHRYREQEKNWTICETHHRKIKTWKASDKGEDQKPLLVQGERLTENPDYRKKQEKRCSK
jgi:hypothetical protein